MSGAWLDCSAAEAAAGKLAEEFPEFDAGLVADLLEQEDGDEGEPSLRLLPGPRATQRQQKAVQWGAVCFHISPDAAVMRPG